MAKAQNIHDTLRWKRKRKFHGGDKCNNAKCTICHAAKVVGIPSVQVKKEMSKSIKKEIEVLMDEAESYRSFEIIVRSMYEPEVAESELWDYYP